MRAPVHARRGKAYQPPYRPAATVVGYLYLSHPSDVADFEVLGASRVSQTSTAGGDHTSNNNTSGAINVAADTHTVRLRITE